MPLNLLHLVKDVLQQALARLAVCVQDSHGLKINMIKTVVCGGPVIWKHLSAAQLETLDRIKPAFLKRAMEFHRLTLSAYTYLLDEASLFVDDLKRRSNHFATTACLELIHVRESKIPEVDPTF